MNGATVGWLAMIGAGVMVIFLAGVFGAVIAILWAFMWSPFGPMLHWGAPQLRGELVFYDRRHILTAKGGGRVPDEELVDRVDHKFAVPAFYGLSTRRGHFILGLMLLRRAAR